MSQLVSYETEFKDDRSAKIELGPSSQYITLSHAFNWFNNRLLGGELPPVLITLQQKRGARGFYCSSKFESRMRANLKADEIALNPAIFQDETDARILSTLVHEMLHHWQYHFGRPGRGGYHNREWANKMERVGLMPSATGEVGGSRSGDRMSHYIIDGGHFDLACKELLSSGVSLEWQVRDPRLDAMRNLPDGVVVVQKLRRSRNKSKYQCPQCYANAWAKPCMSLICGHCQREMQHCGYGS